LFFVFVSASIAAADPSGQIVYSQLTGQYWQIWSMDLKTKESIQLTDSPVDKRDPQCNAEGNQLLYRSANAELFLLDRNNLKESGKQILPELGVITDQQWSEDGKSILLTRMRSDLMDDSDIWLTDIAGENVKEITKQTLLQYHPRFLDAQNIVYVSQDIHSGGHNIWQTKINPEGEQKQLTRGAYYDLLPAVSADHQFIIFSSNRSGSFDIWKIALSTNELRRLTDGAGLETSPSFSLDDQSVVFVSTASGSKQIWFMGSDGSGQVQITDNNAPRQEPSWCNSGSLKE
jgi:TolB protein